MKCYHSVSLENGWTDLACFFFNTFVITRIRFLWKEKLEKYPKKRCSHKDFEIYDGNQNGIIV